MENLLITIISAVGVIGLLSVLLVKVFNISDELHASIAETKEHRKGCDKQFESFNKRLKVLEQTEDNKQDARY
jgi:hypothetical protein